MMGIFSEWNHRRKLNKYLLNEFPRVLVAQFNTFRDLTPDRPKEEIYKIIIAGTSHVFGISSEDRDKYVDHILQKADTVCNSFSIPLCLRAVALAIIIDTTGKTRTIFIATAQTCVWDMIPEDL